MKKEIKDRLECLREALRNESISYGELNELQTLAHHIEPGDIELLEAAGVPEFTEELNKDEILGLLKEKLTDVIDEIPNKYESRDDFSTEEIETESMPGFIPFTDGGTIVRWFEYQSVWASTGHNLPTAPLQRELERQISLYLGGNEDLENETDDTIMISIRAQYYAPSNERGRDGKHTIALSGDVNLESPYHRDGNLDDFIEVVFTFESLEELNERMDAELLKIIDWFNGANFEESIREMKIRRM